MNNLQFCSFNLSLIATIFFKMNVALLRATRLTGLEWCLLLSHWAGTAKIAGAEVFTHCSTRLTLPWVFVHSLDRFPAWGPCILSTNMSADAANKWLVLRYSSLDWSHELMSRPSGISICCLSGVDLNNGRGSERLWPISTVSYANQTFWLLYAQNKTYVLKIKHYYKIF